MDSELEQVMQRWSTAWLEHNATLVDAMMAPEYVYIAPNGEVVDRARILDIIDSPEYALSWGGRSEVTVTMITPDLAIATSRSSGVGTFQRRRFRDERRCSSVFVRRGNAWFVAHEHCSPLPR